jgi:hypothetical protein
MYFSAVNNPSSVHADQGVWAPIDHQRVILLLTIGLGVLYHREKSISLEPLPETMLDEGKASRTTGPPSHSAILDLNMNSFL